MKTFKTKKTHNVPFGRGIINKNVYLKISKIEMDENGVIAYGYYYIIVDGQPYILDHIFPSLLEWEKVEELEKQFPSFDTQSLRVIIFTRAEQFALLKLKLEGTKNYGIEPNDWELYEEPKKIETNEMD